MNELAEHDTRLPQLPILYWLLIAFVMAGLYIIVLLRIDASRSRVLQFRFTSEIQMMDLASGDKEIKKPSPFGKPVRTVRAANRASRPFPTVAQALLPQTN